MLATIAQRVSDEELSALGLDALLREKRLRLEPCERASSPAAAVESGVSAGHVARSLSYKGSRGKQGQHHAELV
jgi:hypothetical protein